MRICAVASLEDAGFEVIDAGNAEEAMRTLHDRPDVRAVFTDVNMPGALNGVELAHLVHDARPDVPVLVTSGIMRPSKDDLPAGGGFIPKPYDVAAVVLLLRQLIRSATAAGAATAKA